jgi:hypothetical protein
MLVVLILSEWRRANESLFMNNSVKIGHVEQYVDNSPIDSMQCSTAQGHLKDSCRTRAKMSSGVDFVGREDRVILPWNFKQITVLLTNPTLLNCLQVH